MKYVYKFFLTLYILVGMVPNFDALDKVTTQWLYLNCLNTIFLILLIAKDYPLKKFFLHKTTILFFCLFLWSLVSLFFAINPIESIVVLSQIFAIVIGFIVIKVCVIEIEKPFIFISNIISIFLLIELTKIYFPFSEFEIVKSKIFSRSGIFLGFAANVNITAFSIIYKIPFFIYSILQLNKFKFLTTIISFIVFFLIAFAAGTLNSTRGAILTYSSLVPVLITIGIVTYFKSKKYRLFTITIMYSIAVLFSFSFNKYLSNSIGNADKNITNRISSLNALLDDSKDVDQSLSQRQNFFSQAANTIIKNPIFGIGIGNWKIKSIDTDRENIRGYVIPYHVHNDFLEIAAEIGLVGLAFYLAILFFAFKEVIIKFLKMIFTKVKLEENYLVYITTSLFLYIYLIDSSINFPFYRPLVLINLVVLISYLSKNLNEKV